MTNWVCKVRENYRAKTWSARQKQEAEANGSTKGKKKRSNQISGCKSGCSVIPIIPGYKVTHLEHFWGQKMLPFSKKSRFFKKSRCLEKRGQVRAAAGMWVAVVQQDSWRQVPWGAGPQGCATWISAAEQGSSSACALMKALIGLSVFPVCPETWKGFSSLKPPLFHCILLSPPNGVWGTSHKICLPRKLGQSGH